MDPPDLDTTAKDFRLYLPYIYHNTTTYIYIYTHESVVFCYLHTHIYIYICHTNVSIIPLFFTCKCRWRAHTTCSEKGVRHMYLLLVSRQWQTLPAGGYYGPPKEGVDTGCDRCMRCKGVMSKKSPLLGEEENARETLERLWILLSGSCEIAWNRYMYACV